MKLEMKLKLSSKLSVDVKANEEKENETRGGRG
jgi:hypothetical protein